MRLAAGRVLALVALALAAGFARRGEAQAPQSPAPSPYRPGIDVLDYQLALDLPDRGNDIRGHALLTVRRTSPVDTLVLDLLKLDVDSVTVDGRRVVAGRTPTEIRIPLPASGAGSTLKVGVAYHGAVEDGLIVRTDSAGRWTGFGDNWPNRGRNWIPSVDHPSDKATVTWIVTAPSNRMVVANGTLEGRTQLPNGRTRTRWRESHPVPVYVMVIAAAPLSEFSLGDTACGFASTGRCVPQYVYVAPEQRDYLPGPFAQAGEIVRYFGELVGPFPYEKLAHLQSSTRFGGMENSSAIFYSDQAFRRHTMSEELIAHETAHQWFGDAVTEREWPHVWLSEGFATYFAALFARHAHGDSAFQSAMARIRERVLEDRDAVPLRPVIDTAQTDLLALLNRNSYEKGGFVLHMLRREVGDSAFFRALRAYYAAHRDGNALTDDLRLAMEKAAGGTRLDWFFDQWLRRPGYPEVDVTWSYDPSSQQVAVDVVQASRFGAYRFPLTLRLRAETGRPGVGVVQVVTISVPAEPRARLVLPGRLLAPPLSVDADPGVELLARIQVHPN